MANLTQLAGFWAGTMDDAEKDVTGSWWRLGQDGSVSKLASGFKVTNGPAFDVERECVFLTDSARQTVFVAETDGTNLGATEPFLQFGSGDGYPDGMEVDREGCLWIAFWDGACVRRFSPTGELLLQIDLPVPRPTSLAIAPEGIYVTSASTGLRECQQREFPKSGRLFFIALDQNLRESTQVLCFR